MIINKRIDVADFEDLSEALNWSPGSRGLSGRAANTKINGALHDLDLAFANYLGSPVVPCLLTYAKNASRTVGLQVSRLEALLRFLRYFDLNALIDARADLLGNPHMVGPLSYLVKLLIKNPISFYSQIKRLRKALVWGNLQAYGSLVPAFCCFLNAETKGENGLNALKNFGLASIEKDPSGLLMRAFTLYKNVAELKEELNGKNGVDAAPLIKLRSELAFVATLSLSFHEQMLFQASQCYGDPNIQQLTSGMSKTLYIEDPIDVVMLLPNGGNWALFTDRMGLDEVDSEELAYVSIRDPDGELRHYVLKENSIHLRGTIFDYLRNRFTSDLAEDLVESPSLPLPRYDDGEGTGFARIYQTYLRATGKYEHP